VCFTCIDIEHILLPTRLLISMHVKHAIPYLYIKPHAWRWTLGFETCRRHRLNPPPPQKKKKIKIILYKIVHFVGLHCVIVLRRAVQKHKIGWLGLDSCSICHDRMWSYQVLLKHSTSGCLLIRTQIWSMSAETQTTCRQIADTLQRVLTYDTS